MRWEPALNAFAITFTDRTPTAETLYHDKRQRTFHRALRANDHCHPFVWLKTDDDISRQLTAEQPQT